MTDGQPRLLQNVGDCASDAFRDPLRLNTSLPKAGPVRPVGSGRLRVTKSSVRRPLDASATARPKSPLYRRDSI